jgi:outer membrane receptor protein involved in Fe transport
VKRHIAGLALPTALIAVGATTLGAQVVTTAAVSGRVTGPGGAPVVGARITAVHRPSGTTYGASTRPDGRYTIQGMRVGGPYTLTVRALGFAPDTRDGLSLSLGTQADVGFALSTVAARLSEVTVQAAAPAGTLSPNRTGAATNINREAIATLPTISRTIGDLTRLTPQASATGAIGGLDSRFNNTTIDGAQFNNAFGLGTGQPGGRTNVSPIPLDAIDQIQVNVAPYDVRQGSFVGAGVNAVTRSGTNEVEGSAYFFGRNERFVGKNAFGAPFNPGTFTFGQYGARLGGPILRNKLFFFLSAETDELTQPGTTFLPNTGGQTVGGNTTRVLATDAQQVSDLLRQRFGYETGPITGYDFSTPSTRALARLDWNASERHKFSLRYTQLNSTSDFPASNSNSLGFGNRRGTTQALSFQNSGYAIKEDNRSVVGEWNAQYGGRLSNNFIVGYTSNDESRKARGAIFPTVDILDGTGATYLNVGFEPFTPANQLRYSTFQAQNNLTVYAGHHELTFGAAAERYRSENVFFPGSQSVYVYNTLADFLTDVNAYNATTPATRSPVTLRRFQVRYNNIPGQDEPLQPLRVITASAYAQDQWTVSPRVKLTYGLRIDVPSFGATGFTNAQANGLTFRDETGAAVQYQTQKLPDTRALFSPRVGFNWNAVGERRTQLRGGTGIFTGRPAYVWISNQIGQNGIQTGFVQADNTRDYAFNPNPDAYKPPPTGQPAASYELNFTNPDFRFPQQWRSNLAVDQRLPLGLVATVEGVYGRDVNGVYYINANLPAAQTRFAGPDQRPRWTANRLNSNIVAAYVLKNQTVGYNYNVSASLEKSFRSGLYAKAAYNYGVAKNTVDPGSIAAGTWTGNPISADPNAPGVGLSTFTPLHRSLVALSYRREYLRLGATTVSLFAERSNSQNFFNGVFAGNTSYTYSGDLNGDGADGNDLLYVPRDRSEMRFLPITAANGTVQFTAQQQTDAWEAYIQQDPYLRKHRGEYAKRNAVFLPQVVRADASLAQEIFRPVFGKRNSLQVRLDVFNVTNLLNKNWGVGRQLVSNQPLAAAGASGLGEAQYRMRVVNGQLLNTTFQRTAGINDVYRMQLGVRYTFQ